MKKFKKRLQHMLTIVLALLAASITIFGLIISEHSFFSSLKHWNEKVYYVFGVTLLICTLLCGLISTLMILMDYQLPKKKIQEIAVNYDVRPMYFQILTLILSIFFFSFILLDHA